MFQHQPHSAGDLERLLSDYFDGLPVEVEQCTGRWIPIREEQITRLGQSNCSLGADCTLGERVFGRMEGWLDQYFGPNHGITLAVTECGPGRHPPPRRWRPSRRCGRA